MTGLSDNQSLTELLRGRIRARGALSFAEFMQEALHHPRWGYYAAGAERLGPEGDFITAGDLGSGLGRCLARQLDELDGALARPDAFHVVEFGAGRGGLARDVLDALRERHPRLAERTHYVAVDRSPGMRESIRRVAPEAAVREPAEAPQAVVGAALAVELFDALPVHRVRRRAGALVEVGVGLDADGGLIEVEIPPADPVSAWADRYGAAAEEGSEAEVCLELAAAFSVLDRAIGRGFVLVLDYGDDAERLYDARRRRGTLLAYHRHGTNEDYLARVGRQDLTAHVNFTALADAAASLGWSRAGSTTQDRFLINHGILERFESMDDAAYRDPAEIRERRRILQLIAPTGMGRIFRVHAFCKGFADPPPLRGFADPFARDAAP